MFEEIEARGAGKAPVYVYLEAQAQRLFGSQSIKWNSTRFLLDRTGKVRARHAPTTTPASLAKEIEALLAS